MKLINKALLRLLAVFITLLPMLAHGQPQPGDVWRQYTVSLGYDGYFRIGGQYAGGGKHLDLNYPLAPYRVDYDSALPQPTPYTLVDLQHATRAELIVGVNKSHAGTPPLYVSFNDNPYQKMPYPSSVSNNGVLFHAYLKVDIPVEQLRETGNTFKFTNETWFTDPQTASTDGRQNILYEMILRVYYNPASVAHASGQITSPAAGGTVDNSGGSDPVITADVTGTEPLRVDFIGYYDDFDRRNDRNWTQWHYRYKLFRRENRAANESRFLEELTLVDHIGTDTTAPYAAPWNLDWVPDQAQPMQLSALVTDGNGVMTMLPAVGGINLHRDDFGVELAKPYNTPTAFNTAQIKVTGGPVNADIAGDLRLATDAYLFFQIWPDGGNDDMGITINGVHHHTFDPGDSQGTAPTGYGKDMKPSQRIPVDILVQGKNDLWPDKAGHHGMEILWPGIGIYIKYDRNPNVHLIDDLEDVSVLPGSPATLRARFGGIPEPTYTWERRLPGGEWETVPGADTPVLAINTTVRADDGTEYRVIADNGGGPVSSRAAKLRVHPILASYQPVGSEISIEAENFDTSVMNGDAHPWYAMQNVAGYSGNGYIWNYYHESVASAWGSVATVGYRFRVADEGSYRPWLRIRKAKGSATHSVIVAFNGLIHSLPVQAADTSFNWVAMPAIDLYAGEHVMEIMRAADGLMVDKIVLSGNPSYTPSGNGPPESPRDIVVDARTRILFPNPSTIAQPGTFMELSGLGLDLHWTVTGAAQATGPGEKLEIYIPYSAAGGSTVDISLSGEGGVENLNVPVNAVPRPLKETGGLLVFETETYVSGEQRSDKAMWAIRTALAGYSGSGYVGTDDIPKNGAVTDPALAAVLRYEADFATTGDYFAWFRVQTVWSWGDSLYLGINGATPTRVNLSFDASVTQWTWYKHPAAFAILSRGVQTIELVNREDGVQVDKIILTTDALYDPNTLNGGLGPDESPRSSQALLRRGYDAWQATSEWPDGADGSPGGDADGDGILNAWEFLMRTKPGHADAPMDLAPEIDLSVQPAVMRWRIPADPEAQARLQLGATGDLVNAWPQGDVLFPASERELSPGTTVTTDPGNPEVLIIERELPVGANGFYRLELDPQP